jgi:hypothetical protein
MGQAVRYFHCVKKGVHRVFVDHPWWAAPGVESGGCFLGGGGVVGGGGISVEGPGSAGQSGRARAA